jgi:ABC-type polysaccharide/polyol phosphate transport system ATPase subunit
MSDDVIISVKNLSKSFKLYQSPKHRLLEALHPFRKQYHHEYHALKDISFEIKRGESVGIIGKNGAGKSTLLKILTGVMTPTSGTVEVKGKIAALLELGSGFNPNLSGMENIFFQGAIMGFSEEEMKSKVQEIVDFADIGEYIHQPVKTYSSGMFARLAFSIAISVEPDILIVDEALSVGDIKFQLKCHLRIKNLIDCGTTIIYVSHSSVDIRRICETAIWIEAGRIKKQGHAKLIVESFHASILHDVPLVETEIPKSGLAIEPSMVDSKLNNLKHFFTGVGGVHLIKAELLNEGLPVTILSESHNSLHLIYILRLDEVLTSPVFCFQILNQTGIRLFGSNTYVKDCDFKLEKNPCEVKVSFRFQLPELMNGAYFIEIGVYDGSPENHVRIINIPDALVFEYQSLSKLQSQSPIVKLPDCEVSVASLSLTQKD